MKTWPWRTLGTTGLGVTLAALTGCQTWLGGMTLPSGHYLQHPPQYFPPSPSFPLSRELAQQQGAVTGAAPAGVAVPAGQGPIASPAEVGRQIPAP
jgi:hypothetical protein